MKTRYRPEDSDGVRLADFVSASDAAAAVRLAVEQLGSGCAIPEVLDISSGVALRPAEALEIAAKVNGVEIEPGPTAPTNERLVTLSPLLAETTLGWRPATPADEIVESELSFLRKRSFAPRRADKQIGVANEYLTSSLSAEFLSIWGMLVTRDRTRGFDLRDLSFEINGTRYTADFFPRGGLRLPRPRSLRIGLYRLRIPRQDVEVLPAQTAVRLVYSGPKSRWFDIGLGYSRLSRTPLARHGPLFPIHDGSSRLFVRQTGGNRMFLTLREKNVTDTLWSKIKVLAARAASLAYRKNAVLLYEKESSRYEESASVVFESLLDRGRDDVYFILDASMIGRVPERYRSKVIDRFSFRHFYHIFSARTLIGTELVAHATELRTIDKSLRHRLQSAEFGYVFLQHGVMYMVALNSTQRSFFRAGPGFPQDGKIVCSSEREKRHFVDLGGFPPENMYVCGLPKFDRAERDPDADRILIMPTWRPWEYNTVRTNPEQSGYFAMLIQMYDAVPVHLKDRVWILPHPLVRESLEPTDLGSRLWAGESYEAALRRGALLVTDYSSIAYDAFYRGANVVFWWKDKDERAAFGPVCYDAAALSDAIASSYGQPQDPEHTRRYEEIVEFRDGCNTQRLIEMMERDQLV